MNDFKSIPVESDTKIISEQEIQVANLPALHQNWSCDGIAAESIVFHADDVKDFTDDELFEKVKEYYTQTYLDEPKTNYHTQMAVKKIDDRYTTVRDSSGFTFVNFNFLTADDFL